LTQRPFDLRLPAVSGNSKHKRRTRSSVERAGADARLADLLDQRPKLTYDEIRAILEADGFNLSRSAIGRWAIDYVDQQREFKERLAQAKALVTGDSRAILTLEEANASLLQSKLLGHLQSKRDVDKEVYDIAYAVAALTSSASQRERVRLAREKAIRLAAKRIKADIKRELNKHPDLVARLTSIAEAAETALLDAEGAR
jgi:hypothetical protein